MLFRFVAVTGLSTRDALRQRLTATTSNFPRFASANLIRYNSCDRELSTLATRMERDNGKDNA